MPDKELRDDYDLGKAKMLNAETIPVKYRDEIKNIMLNFRAIHGNNAVIHLCFINNLKALIAGLISNIPMLDKKQKEILQRFGSDLASELTGSHRRALNLTKEQEKNVFNAINAMDSVVKHLAKDPNEDIS